MKNYILLLLLATFGTQAQTLQNPTFGTVKIKNNITSATATKVNVQEANGEVNTQTINTGFNKNIGLGGSDVVGANTLLNQYSTTPVDWTATTFSSGQVVFYGGKQWIAKMATVAGDVPAVSPKWEEITFEALANKTVTVDQTIIDGSTNAVSSNAVFDGFDGLATKSNIGHTHVASQITDLSKASVGLGNVDNTSDLSKPLSTATINALATKFPTPTGLTTNYLPKWNGSGFGNSSIFDNGTNIGIGTTNPTANLTVKGAYSVGSSIPPNWALLSAGRTGVANNNKGLYFDIFNGYAEVSTYDWGLGQAYPMVFQGNGGNSMFGTNVDNGVDRVQVAGTISASPATTANQVVIKSQLDAVGTPYKLYTFYVNQSGANIPTSVTLNNNTTINSIPTWERTGVGDYRFFIGTVNTTKVFPYAVQSSFTFGNDIFAASVQGQYIQITRRTNGVLTDGLNNNLFEIRIYP